jgi:hypothetical protein
MEDVMLPFYRQLVDNLAGEAIVLDAQNVPQQEQVEAALQNYARDPNARAVLTAYQNFINVLSALQFYDGSTVTSVSVEVGRSSPNQTYMLESLLASLRFRRDRR